MRLWRPSFLLAFIISILATPAAWAEQLLNENPVSEIQMAKVYARYGKLTGNAANMASLVTGLQNGSPVVLKRRLRKEENHSLVLNIPTKPMSDQDITNTLEIATESLNDAGIRNPTIEQLHAVLMGGAVIGPRGRLTNMQGILVLRSEGMEWDEVAYHLGISSMKEVLATGIESSMRVEKGSSQSRQRSRIVNLNGKGQNEVHTAAGGSPRTVTDAYLAGESRGIVTANGDRAGYAGITTGSGSGYDGGSYAASAAVSGMVGANTGATVGSPGSVSK
jgi:hypothetical protein